MLDSDKVERLGLADKKKGTATLLQTTRDQSLNKLAQIMSFKVEKDIRDTLEGDKQPTAQQLTKCNNSLITSFLQMV